MEKNIFTPTKQVTISEATQNLINAQKAFNEVHLQMYKALKQWHGGKSEVLTAFFQLTNQLDALLYTEVGAHVDEDLNYIKSSISL